MTTLSNASHAHRPRSAAPGTPSRELSAIAAHYRSTLDDGCRIVGESLVLPLTHGREAFVLPAPWATGVRHELGRSNVDGPVLGVPGYWVFLVEANDQVVRADDLPAGAGYLRCPAVVPLPPTRVGSEIVRWVRPPVGGQVWLPTATAVLAAVRRCGTPAAQAMDRPWFTQRDCWWNPVAVLGRPA